MFSKTTEYGLRATIFIAQKGSKARKLSLDEITKAINSPRSFTAKILQILTRDNLIITSSRGPNGGYYITEDAKRLPVIKILEVLGEESVLNKCILGLAHCSDENPCPLHADYRMIKPKLIAMFHEKTIGFLASENDSLLKL